MILKITQMVLNPFMTEAVTIDLQSKSMDWFLYDNGIHRERVKTDTNQTVWTTRDCMKYVRKGQKWEKYMKK